VRFRIPASYFSPPRDGPRCVAADTPQRGDIVVISDGEDQSHEVSKTRSPNSRSAACPGIDDTSSGRVGSTIPRPDGGGDSGRTKRAGGTTYARPEASADRGGARWRGSFYANQAASTTRLTHWRRPRDVKQRNRARSIERYQWPLAFGLHGNCSSDASNRGAE